MSRPGGSRRGVVVALAVSSLALSGLVGTPLASATDPGPKAGATATVPAVASGASAARQEPAQRKAIPEGEGSLLDNCLILFGSSISDGNRHDPDNLPILLGGRGGGVESGRHLAAEGSVPLCNLYLSMLDRMGVEVERFGDSTGRLL